MGIFSAEEDCMEGIKAFIKQYLSAYTPYKTYWNYEAIKNALED